MTPVARKGVLLRLTPELLAQVDVARGALNRTAWITAVIIARLEAIAEADATLYDEEFGEPTPIHFAVDEEVGTPTERDAYVQGARDALAIVDEDGTELDLTATRRDDGVLEIGHSGGLFSDTVSPKGEGSGTPAGDEPRSEHEGPDRGSHTLDTSPSGEPADQGYPLPVGPGERGEGSDAALRSSSSEQGLREPESMAEGESSKGSDMARDADTPRDTDSPTSTDGVGWPD